ncbi:GNAT family N-acetyltransferase [Gilvimarinus sp. F26214L]|uniref:GNAT family N-acetyltransferase n=1 Tax=Gilvimarinus sp. DZF01 TaxID=3461371 RepID=UPI0040461AFF
MNDLIEHQVERHRFVLPNANGDARLEYEVRPAKGPERDVINFTYTYVPPSMRGQGVAERLVRRGLSWAREENFRIEASCWYVQKFLR